MGGNDLGIGAVRAPYTDSQAPEVCAAQTALDALEAVVAGQPTTQPRTNLTEREIDLVVYDHEAFQRDLESVSYTHLTLPTTPYV